MSKRFHEGDLAVPDKRTRHDEYGDSLADSTMEQLGKGSVAHKYISSSFLASNAPKSQLGATLSQEPAHVAGPYLVMPPPMESPDSEPVLHGPIDTSLFPLTHTVAVYYVVYERSPSGHLTIQLPASSRTPQYGESSPPLPVPKFDENIDPSLTGLEDIYADAKPSTSKRKKGTPRGPRICGVCKAFNCKGRGGRMFCPHFLKTPEAINAIIQQQRQASEGQVSQEDNPDLGVYGAVVPLARSSVEQGLADSTTDVHSFALSLIQQARLPLPADGEIHPDLVRALQAILDRQPESSSTPPVLPAGVTFKRAPRHCKSCGSVQCAGRGGVKYCVQNRQTPPADLDIYGEGDDLSNANLMKEHQAHEQQEYAEHLAMAAAVHHGLDEADVDVLETEV